MHLTLLRLLATPALSAFTAGNVEPSAGTGGPARLAIGTGSLVIEPTPRGWRLDLHA